MTGNEIDPVGRTGSAALAPVRWLAACGRLVAGLALLAMPFAGAVAADANHWAATWATASKTVTPFDAPLPTLNDTTIRQVVRISMGGARFRVWLTNEFGTAPLNVGEARLARRAGGQRSG